MLKNELTRRKLLIKTGLLSASTILPSLSFANYDSRLEQKVEQLIKEKRRLGLITPDEKTAWSIYDFKRNQKLVSINENKSMQAASMVKVFVALAYFYLNKLNPNKYPYNTTVRNNMEAMIVHSSNQATNYLMKKAGGPRSVQRLCQKATNSLFKQLYIVEYIPQNGRTYKNRASARDYSRFLYALWHSRLAGSKEIKRILLMSNNDRIRTKTNLPNSLKIYDKTGSTSMLCGNMGIIHTNTKYHSNAYTFIGIIEKNSRAKSYSNWISSRGDAIRDVSELAYQYIKQSN